SRNFWRLKFKYHFRKFLDDQKSRGKPAVSSSSKNTVSVHLTFYLKTVRDSFIGNLLFFQLLKMQKPSDCLEFSLFRYRNVTRLDAKDGIVKCDEHSRNIQITFKTRYD
ncbi:hypothetical protein WUBG_07962, partial [Wuchereria bancrofti]